MKKHRIAEPVLFNLPVRICLALFYAVAVSAHADIITVTNTHDDGAGSLRQALADANDGDTIDFDPALKGQTITLTSDQLVIGKDVTISGPGPDLLAVSRSSNNQFRIFYIMPGHNVAIRGLTVSNGYFSGGGIFNDHSNATVDNCTVRNNSGTNGGGIFSTGQNGSAALIISNTTVSSNLSTGGYGGAIYNAGSNGSAVLTISDSLIDFNSAPFFPPNYYGQGGGIYNDRGTVTITDSAINRNIAGYAAGAIWNALGTLTITNSTINNNTTGDPSFPGPREGGGIENQGTLTLTNSTVSNNRALGGEIKGPGIGGGIVNGGFGTGNATITNSTISGNTASGGGGQPGFGGGIVNDSGGVLSIVNTTLSANSAENGGTIWTSGGVEIGNSVLNAGASGANIINSSGTVTSHGYNVCSDDGGGFLNGPGDQINTDPMLGPLQDNGGPTFTHELLTGSPAIDAGDPNFTPPPYYDQRGPVFWRVRNGRIDVGSFEVQVGTTPSPTPTPTASPTPTPTATATAAATATATPSATPTSTPTATPTATATPTGTPRATPTPRLNPTPRLHPSPPPRP